MSRLTKNTIPQFTKGDMTGMVFLQDYTRI